MQRKKENAILYLYRKKKPKGNFSFKRLMQRKYNSAYHKKNARFSLSNRLVLIPSHTALPGAILLHICRVELSFSKVSQVKEKEYLCHSLQHKNTIFLYFCSLIVSYVYTIIFAYFHTTFPLSLQPPVDALIFFPFSYFYVFFFYVIPGC